MCKIWIMTYQAELIEIFAFSSFLSLLSATLLISISFAFAFLFSRENVAVIHSFSTSFTIDVLVYQFHPLNAAEVEKY